MSRWRIRKGERPAAKRKRLDREARRRRLIARAQLREVAHGYPRI